MRPGHRQKGTALLLIVIAAAALVGVVGLAIDASHVGYLKARLQSTVDAMALAAAKRLDQQGTTAAACQAALETLAANEAEFRELRGSHPVTTVCPSLPWFSIEYSATVAPFVAGTTPARYVRVAIVDLKTGASLSRALGLVDLAVSARAVAGPSSAIEYLCSLLPIAVCGTSASPNFGFVPGNVYLLKGKKNDADGTSFGDFHLLRPDDPTRDDQSVNLREDFAGGFGECRLVRGGTTPRPTVRIKPGANIGPVAQGVNTRFNEYLPTGQMDPVRFPPDVLIVEPSPILKVDKDNVIRQGSRAVTTGSDVVGPRNVANLRQTYVSRLAQGPSAYDIAPLPSPGRGALLRREVAVPIADCSPPIDENALPLRGAGCFFLVQRMAGGASESTLIGEYLTDCEAAGRPGSTPGSGGPYTIQLVRDAASSDS